ncbi:MAG TPA: hypothetical protein VI197_05185 [Polyangiaceae bacterium]
MSNSMGMIQVDGITYRIAHLGRNAYEVVRLLDDVSLGAFRPERASLNSTLIGADHSLRHIASIAVRQGKTKWRPVAPASGWKGFAIERMARVTAYFLLTPPQRLDRTGSPPSMQARA